jgi:hypothetical protein
MMWVSVTREGLVGYGPNQEVWLSTTWQDSACWR